MTTSFLVIGASGGLGRRIVSAVNRQPDTVVRLGVRDRARSTSDLYSLVDGAADFAEIDLADQSSLERACDGIDVVISAVQGGPDIIVDGQTMLMNAAKEAGVRRLIPSDFSFVHFGLNEGENWNSDMRRAFAGILKASGLGHTFFLNGGFMEAVTSPFMQMVDVDKGTLSFWGEAETAIDLTSMDDAAAYCVAAALDPATIDRTVEVVGQRASMVDISEAYTAVKGHPLALCRLGSLEEGYHQLEEVKRSSPEAMAALPLMYQLPMMSGRATLTDPQNSRFPEINPESLVDLLNKQGGVSVA